MSLKDQLKQNADVLKQKQELEDMKQKNYTIVEYPNAWPVIQADNQRSPGFATALNSLDVVTEGVKPGELIVVTASTGTGKTCFCQTITKHLAELNYGCLWFTLEVSLPNFLKPFIQHDPKIDEVRAGKIDKLSDWPIYFPTGLKQVNFEAIEDLIKLTVAKYKVRAVFIDHLHYLALGQDQKNKQENFSLFLGSCIRRLRKIALDTGVAIFLVAHMTKTTDGFEPSLSDIRDTSFAAQEADIVYVLWRDKLKVPQVVEENGVKYEQTYYPWTNCKVDKARRTGRRGRVTLMWEKGLYFEITPEERIKIRGKIDLMSAPRD